MATEYCIVDDEGVVEDDFWSMDEAINALTNYNDASLEIDLRSNYDNNGIWIEE